MSREPAVIVGTITGAVTALIALLVAFGLPLTNEQTGAILALVGVVAPIAAAYIIRGRVYAPETVADITDSAYASGQVSGFALGPPLVRPSTPLPPQERPVRGD